MVVNDEGAGYLGGVGGGGDGLSTCYININIYIYIYIYINENVDDVRKYVILKLLFCWSLWSAKL